MGPRPAVEIAPLATLGLADRLKQRTWNLHREAEQSGVYRAMLAGTLSRDRYVLFLRNLLPVYEGLEGAFARAPTSRVARRLAPDAIRRGAALRHDLARLGGASCEPALPLLGPTRAYVDLIHAAAAAGGERLVAHAYVRYLGDLNGGQILKRVLGRHLGLAADDLTFYAFPAIVDLRAYARAYRDRLDSMADRAFDDAILDEAEAAFRLTIDLSAAIMEAPAATPINDGNETQDRTGVSIA